MWTRADSIQNWTHMTNLTELNSLIDRAAAIAGSDYRLAKHLGVPRGHVSQWRHAKRTATPADQALMAHIAGLDPVQVLARATVEAYEGKPKGDALMKALGNVLLATGAAVGSRWERVPFRNFLTKTFRKILQKALVWVMDRRSFRPQAYRKSDYRT